MGERAGLLPDQGSLGIRFDVVLADTQYQSNDSATLPK
jgi:hypothetical protein